MARLKIFMGILKAQPERLSLLPTYVNRVLDAHSSGLTLESPWLCCSSTEMHCFIIVGLSPESALLNILFGICRVLSKETSLLKFCLPTVVGIPEGPGKARDFTAHSTPVRSHWLGAGSLKS